MNCKFRQHKKSEAEVRFDKIKVTKCKQFRFLGSSFHDNRMIDI